ncbi:MAG: single-stranded-DNA-specific exonuclease RecJ, partial [Thermodesulfobacteriota bacterium]
MKNKKWIVAKQNPKLSRIISDKLNISSTTAQVLINRGINSDIEAESFLNPSLFDLPSPFLMKGMQDAVDRLKEAVYSREKIAIYGDYDVDGVTGTSLLYNFLKFLNADIIYYNPDRFKEGYGINKDAIKNLKDEGVKLIVSVDCGITAFEEVEYAKGIGIDFIITDHHEPPGIMPPAVSVLNPHQEGCKYPGKEIVGVGVVFNLTLAMRRVLRDEGYFKKSEPNLGDYLDLVALGTVADCAPLINVNRVVVSEGLKRMENPKRIGLKALKEVSGIKADVSSYDLGFKLGPRINAMGRMGSACEAVELFISDEYGYASELAHKLNSENNNRQNTEKDILESAIKMADSDEYFINSNSVVLSSGEWHQGVIGIVASRIAERYQKPAFLIAVDENGMGKGSGRSIDGINIYKALCECQKILENFGGHELAAGITIKEDKIPIFREMFSKALEEYPAMNTKKL